MSTKKWRVDVELVYSPLRNKTIIVESKTRREAERIALQKAEALYAAPIYEVTNTRRIKGENNNVSLRTVY